jgi:sporulation protein YlmC with PRC-barrel domain
LETRARKRRNTGPLWRLPHREAAWYRRQMIRKKIDLHMERNMNSLVGYRIVTKDGEIGKVDEFFFDDRTWTMRYAIVKMEEGLRDQRVLIATDALAKDDEAAIFFISFFIIAMVLVHICQFVDWLVFPIA